MVLANIDTYYVLDESDVKPITGAEFALEAEPGPYVTNKGNRMGVSLEKRAFMSAKCRKMVKQNRLNKVMGPHNSGVVLVPHSDIIAAFKEKYRARAPIVMFEEEAGRLLGLM